MVVPRGLAATADGESSGADRLEAVACSLRSRGLEVIQSQREGNPANEIVAHAEEVSADYLVLGCHKKGAIERALLGSVSQAVLQNAPCPVLLVDATSMPDEEA